MHELLLKSISKEISLTEEEMAICKSLFTVKTLRRRQYFLQEGNVGSYQAFVVKGILRSYLINEKGIEHILQFASEGWWAADLSSFLSGEPSGLNIEALEDAELLVISAEAWNQLLEVVPKLERYFRILVQNHMVATQKRLLQTFSETAAEKYIRFTNTYPDCVQRVPQYMIASYLGITRETLSRLRKSAMN